jgi:hypothetical protein
MTVFYLVLAALVVMVIVLIVEIVFAVKAKI